MSFIENNWYLVPRAGRFGRDARLAARPAPAVAGEGRRHLEATRLINSANAVLVDVRETKEFEGGRLPKAVHIPLSQLESRSGELAKLQGPAGGRLLHDAATAAASPAKLLAQAGFKDIYQLRGGYRAWKDAGLPVEK